MYPLSAHLTDFANAVGLDIKSLLPKAGEIRLFGGSPPNGWLLCDGRTFLCADHPELFVAIGNTYGRTAAGKFKIPSMSGVPATVSTVGAFEVDTVFTIHLPGSVDAIYTVRDGDVIESVTSYLFGEIVKSKGYKSQKFTASVSGGVITFTAKIKGEGFSVSLASPTASLVTEVTSNSSKNLQVITITIVPVNGGDYPPVLYHIKS